MTTLELNDHDKAALAAVLRATIAADRYPFSPRVQQLRAILERLDPLPVRPRPLPPPWHHDGLAHELALGGL